MNEEEENALSENCTGSYYLCSSEDDCEENAMPVQVQATAASGNVYFNVIQTQGSSVKEGDIVKGAVYDEEEGIQFNHGIQAQLVLMESLMKNTTTADKIVLVDLGNRKARSTSALRFILSSNPAYLDGRPWLVFLFLHF